MFKRTVDKQVSTPCAARNIVKWALGPHLPGYDQQSAAITARVFTAFMFEGVIHHLGETLVRDWDVGDRKAQSWQPLGDRHKAVRKLLGLSNVDQSYQNILSIIRDLVTFRDGFAHPKLHREIIQDQVVSTEGSMSPPIAWEREIDTIKIEREFKQIAEYCQQLLDAAADVLEQTWQAGWSVWQQTFPHIPDSHRAAVDLRAFLDLGSMAGYTLTPG